MPNAYHWDNPPFHWDDVTDATWSYTIGDTTSGAVTHNYHSTSMSVTVDAAGPVETDDQVATNHNIELDYGDGGLTIVNALAALHNYTVSPSTSQTALINDTNTPWVAFRVGDENDNAIRSNPLNVDTGIEVDFDFTQTAVRDNTAQAGGASTITLDASASGDDDAYNTMRVLINAGTGIGQNRVITDYDGTTKVATVNSAWSTQPNATSQYVIYDDNVPPVFTAIKATIAGQGSGRATGIVGLDLSDINGGTSTDEYTQAARLTNPPALADNLPATLIVWGGAHQADRPRLGAFDGAGGQSIVIGGSEAYEANAANAGSIGSTVPSGYSTSPSKWLRIYDESGTEYIIPCFQAS